MLSTPSKPTLASCSSGTEKKGKRIFGSGLITCHFIVLAFDEIYIESKQHTGMPAVCIFKIHIEHIAHHFGVNFRQAVQLAKKSGIFNRF